MRLKKEDWIAIGAICALQVIMLGVSAFVNIPQIIVLMPMIALITMFAVSLTCLVLGILMAGISGWIKKRRR